jgi:hypothetical protein
MLEAFSTPSNRKRAFILFGICVALAVAATAVGVADNLPGILLAFASVGAFIVAFVHPWRAPKHFLWLICAFGVGFIVSAVLHNVLYGAARKVGASGVVHNLLSGAGVAFFLIAVLVCPPGLLVGIVGAIATWMRKGHSRAGAPAA